MPPAADDVEVFEQGTTADSGAAADALQPPAANSPIGVSPSDEVAMAGSPNTNTDISFDVRSDHLRTPLLGTLVRLDVPVHAQHGPEDLLVLGQVSKLVTENRWHEDPSLKNYIKL